jgi:hypothetical protein
MSFDAGGKHVTIIKRRGEPGAETASGPNVLRYKDAEGRDVTVVADKPVTRAEAETLERDMRARVPQIAKAAREHALAEAEAYRKRALEYGAEARKEGEAARKEGEKARQYAEVIVKRLKDKDGDWSVGAGPELDGADGPRVFVRRFDHADGGELRALRDEVKALREEIEGLRAQLKGGLAR